MQTQEWRSAVEERLEQMEKRYKREQAELFRLGDLARLAEWADAPDLRDSFLAEQRVRAMNLQNVDAEIDSLRRVRR